MAKRKTRVRKHIIADMSLHHLSYITVSCSFTIEPTSADYGYDATIYTFDDNGEYENGNIFVQLKATDVIKLDKKNNAVKFRISKRDILTWEEEPFPVYLVVFDAKSEKAYSLYLQNYFEANNISSATVKGHTKQVLIPFVELDMAAIKVWRNEKNAVLAQLGAVVHV